MRISQTKAVLLAAALALRGAVQAGQTSPTPEIVRIDALDMPGTAAWAMKGALGDGSITVGLAAVCATEGPRRAEAMAFFGAFPGDRRPVQLAVRIAEGTVQRFDPADVARFARAAFRPGSLVSNGYRSLWKQASEAGNREVREAFLSCLGRRP